ncbi:NKG2-C type II integral membrane protein-like [Carlito syrichta]|uniref:NKG2-C type II integral membrane protein-like n=1 Tax=Carlito syrichta TaxID=1868482 RepID=A0A3Q0DJV6_CARSF|nr:NKG2-C type II integral membrane protein-like [Carlito syrichta]
MSSLGNRIWEKSRFIVTFREAHCWHPGNYLFDINSGHATATQKQTNSFQNESNQKAYNCSCPEEWFTYSSSSYYMGKETKTWEESMMACASMNSSLLYIDDEEEMKLLVSLVHEAWIGVSRKSSDHPWVSIKGSMFKHQ